MRCNVLLFVVSLAYLDNHFKGENDIQGDEGASLETYRHSLLMGDGDTTSATNKSTAAAKRGRSAKRKLPLDGLGWYSHIVNRRYILFIVIW